MPKGNQFFETIFRSKLTNFDELALKCFGHQFENNKIYQQFCKLVGINSFSDVCEVKNIPFLPVEFFKTHKVICSEVQSEIVFSSSSTSGKGESSHYVSDLKFYEESFKQAFKMFYGNPDELVILALLPSYSERKDSSLIYMAEKLILMSNKTESGSYLYNFDQLAVVLNKLNKEKKKTLLLGVTFALLDFSENHTIDFPELIILETGGMKGRREEITREELHKKLSIAFGVEKIHSEYGMTELLSQAYSKDNGIFNCPPWMKIFISDLNDPFKILENQKAGIINVIDMANINSCCFIKTSDVGRVFDDGSFEVLGRMDNSDLRGCSLITV